MKKVFKSFVAVLLAFTMFMLLLPAGVMAADGITVYISVIQNGEFAIGKNGETMAHMPVAVNTQAPTIDDTFTALHETYYIDGASGYKTTQMPSYTSITNFWGVNSSAIGYRNNNEYAMGPTDAVEDGAHLVSWFYQDTNGWSDAYTFFDKTTASVACGNALNLTLVEEGGSPLSGAVITVDGVEASDAITDSEGKAALTFEEGGTYTVSAKYTNSYFVPPVCIVTATEEGKTDAEYVAEDKEALDIIYTPGQNITLPKTGNSGKTTIEWHSDSAGVDADTGVVTLPDEDTTVILTATITCNDEYDTREFTITIPGRMSVAKSILEALTLEPVEYTNATDYGFKYSSEAKDTNILTLVCKAINDDNITAEIAPEFTSDIIDAEGNITYPADEAEEITLPLRLTFNEQSTDISVTAVIPRHAQTKKEAIDAMKSALEAYINDPLVLNGNSSLDEVKTTLLLPGGKSTGLYIKWTSNITSVIANQTSYSKIVGSPTHPSGGYYEIPILRPGGQDATVTLTAEIACRSTSVDLPAGPWPTNAAERKVSFTVKVPALSEAERKAILDGAASDIRIFDKNGAIADIRNIKYNLYFPSYSGFTTSWSTNIEGIDIPASGYGKATVTRPTKDADDLVGTITIKLTAGIIEETKTFDAKVPAWTEEDLNAAQNKLNQVAEALTFDVIKGANTSSDAVVSNLFLKRFAGFTDGEVNLDHYTKTDTNEWPIAITWEITPDDGPVTYNDKQANKGTGIVTPPTTETTVSLKAKINYRTPISGVNEVEKTITVTVIPAKTATHLNLINNIAATYDDADDTDEWVLLDMSAYAKLFPDATAKISDDAKQTLINNVISMLTTGKTAGGWDASDGDYAKAILALCAIGIDPERLYAVNNNVTLNACTKLKDMSFTGHYNAPYVLLANQFGKVKLSDTQISGLVTLLKKNQSESGLFGYEWDGQAYTDPDTTASAIAGLAGLYSTNDDAKTVVDKAISGLSAIQTETGSFGNANTDAMVITGLAAMGINPDTDSRFIKNENSLLDGLLSHKNSSADGFLFYGEANALATEQGFRALIAAYGIMTTGTATNIYDFSDNTLVPGRATGTGTVVTPSAPGGDSITVTVTIKADTGYWLNNKSVSISGSGATVYHALIKALDNSGITQVGAASGYVKSMTKGGYTLAEFDNGSGSGWMYKVNGELPKTGLTECAIDDGDKIVWFYTVDWSTVPGSFGGGSTSGNKKTEDKDEDKDKDNEAPQTPVFSETTFADVKKDDWHYEAVKYVYENGFMKGTGKGFEPDMPMTRAMLVTVLFRMSKEASNGTSSFTDVQDGEWYSDAIIWATEKGIVSGMGNGMFMPDSDVTREQTATILCRYAEYMKISLPEKSGKELTDFDDSQNISDYSANALMWAVKSGIINGMTETELMPGSNSTRAQIATILMRFSERN